MGNLEADVVIVGAGPAGLFMADRLTRMTDVSVIVLDMGREMDKRNCPATMECDCKTCDILEGIGGAGGFSDGKNTYSLGRGTQLEEIFDPGDAHLLREIDDIFLRYGITGVRSFPQGSPHIFDDSPFTFETYDLRHVGTDGIQEFIQSYADELRGRPNVRIFSRTEVSSIMFAPTEATHHFIYGRNVDNGTPLHIRSRWVSLATGLQGAPWLEDFLAQMGVPFMLGPAGFGMRFEAPKAALDPLFDLFYDFKLTYKDEASGYLLRSFCCNRDGYITNENHRTLGVKNVNGHSYLDKEQHSSGFSNFAIIAKIPQGNAQDAVRTMGRRINLLADGTAYQNANDFLEDRATPIEVLIERTNQQAVAGVDFSNALSNPLANAFKNFIKELTSMFDIDPRSVTLYAPEIKYYGKKLPINFTNWKLQDMSNVYVVGNATGYFDSFVSAAVTGIIAARDILLRK